MNHKPFTHETDIDERARRLSACYRFILSWPDSLEKKTEPAADYLGGKTITISKYSLIHPGSIKYLNEPDVNLHD